MSQLMHIKGELLRFTFQADTGGFAVAKFTLMNSSKVDLENISESSEKNLPLQSPLVSLADYRQTPQAPDPINLGVFSAIGNIGHATPGQILLMTGCWKSHPTYGQQFKVDSAIVESPQTRSGMILYLSSAGFKGLGKGSAEKIVSHFGLETLKILQETPQKLKEVPGIGKKRLEQILLQLGRQEAHQEMKAALRGLSIGPVLSERLIEAYGEETLAIITREPYRLIRDIRGVGFKTADNLALRNGISKSAPERLEAALIHTLQSSENEGHCFLPLNKLIERAAKLDICSTALSNQLNNLLERKILISPLHSSLISSSPSVYRPVLCYTERRVAARLLTLLRSDKEQGLFGSQQIDYKKLEDMSSLSLHEQQRQAVGHSLVNGVTIITGGPGTGKTTIVKLLMLAAQLKGEQWTLAAPTGRAAKRLSEATGFEAQTIHRLLAYNGHSRQFTHNEENPIKAHAVLIDEASMIDIWLMDALLSAVKSSCKLILVGDVDQLPSVGPGRVLADLIESTLFPVNRLTRVYRQAMDSNIVKNAHRVNQSTVPKSCEKDQDASSQKDFFILYRSEAAAVTEGLITIVKDRLPKLGFNPLKDIQILTPMHSGQLGTSQLNQLLQETLNPHGKAHVLKGTTKSGAPRSFREGDRVLQLRNDYENEIYNGDIGFVEAVDEQGVSVRFGNRLIDLAGKQLSYINLAYAKSIHKSQGSEYPAVVIVLHNCHRIMLRQNLLYTAITRASEFCCIIGHPWAVAFTAREEQAEPRHTSLIPWLHEHLNI